MGLADLLGIADLDCRKVESTKWLKHKQIGDCRPGLPNGRKYKVVKTQTESHV